MMKYIVTFILLILVFSCKYVSKSENSSLIMARPNIKYVLDSFIRVVGKTYPVYSLYIDKISPHDYDFIIYAGKESLTKEEDQVNTQSPVQKAQVSNVEFKIYSGVEHYFQNDTINSKTTINGGLYNDKATIWAAKDRNGIISIEEVDNAYPFLPLPNKVSDSLRFSAPVNDSTKY